MVTDFVGGCFRLDGRRALAFRVELPADIDTTNASWICVIPGEGKWEGHHDGAFEVTEETIDTILANFDKRRTPVPCDYEHDRVYSQGGPIKSSGHAYKLEKRHGESGAQLWAYVKWTKLAASMIRDEEYQFNSPVIIWDMPDDETGDIQGPTLHSIALTDDPFFQGQGAARLSRLTHTPRKAMADKTTANATAAALETEDEDKEETAAQGEDMLEDEIPGEETAAQDEPIEMEEPSVALSPDGLLTSLAEATGLTPEDVLVKLTKMVDGLVEKINAMADAEQGAAAMSNKPKTEDAARTAAERKERLEKSALTARVVKLERVIEGYEKDREKTEEARKSALSARVQVEAKRLIDEGHQLDTAKQDLIDELSECETDAELDRRVRLLSAGKVVPTSQSRREIRKDDDGNTVLYEDDLTIDEKRRFSSFMQSGVWTRKYGAEQGRKKALERVVALREN